MTFGSVCSGIDAPSVAWGPLGWRPAFFAEIDPFPSAVLAHRHPGVPNLGDFTTIEASPEPVRLLVGGTPCQDFSVAGLRKGLDGDRGNLTLEFLRLAGRLRPDWLVWENVPGVLSVDGGRAFGAFLGGLVELGYGFAYRVLDAQHFGVPQRRRRVFVVGYSGDWRRAAAVLFERDCLSGNPPPRRQARETVTPSVTPGARRASGNRSGELLTTAPVGFETYGHSMFREGVGPLRAKGGDAGDGSETLIAHASRAFGGNNTAGDIEVATAVNAHGGPHGRLDFERETFIAHTLRADGFDASEDGTGRGTPLVAVPGPGVDLRNLAFTGEASHTVQAGTHPPDPGGIPHAFIVNAAESCAVASHARHSEVARCIDSTGSFANAQGGTVVATLADASVEAEENERIRRVVALGRPEPTPIDMRQASRGATMTNNRPEGSSGGAPGTGIGEPGDPSPSLSLSHPPAVATRSAVRRLTPRECERLQGFPDDFTLIPYRGKPAADGPRCRALGNSMAVPVMRWIGRRIQELESTNQGAAK